jgi:hypothetical protein
MWTRGDRVEAVRWVKRASDEASEQGDDDRAFSLARAAADLKAVAGASVMPPATDVAPIAVPLTPPPPAPAAFVAPIAVPPAPPAPPPPAPPPPAAAAATATPLGSSAATPIPGARPSPSPAARSAAPAAKLPSSPPPAGGYPAPTAGTRPPPPKRPVPNFNRPPPKAAPSSPSPAPASSAPSSANDRDTAVPSEPPQRAARLPGRNTGAPIFGGQRPEPPAARAPMNTPTEVFTSARAEEVADEGPPPTPRNAHAIAAAAVTAAAEEPPPRDESSDDGPTQSFTHAERSMAGFDHDSSTMDAPTRFIQVVQAEKALAAREARKDSGAGTLSSHRVWIYRTDEGTGVRLAEGERPEGAIEAMLVTDDDLSTLLDS